MLAFDCGILDFFGAERAMFHSGSFRLLLKRKLIESVTAKQRTGTYLPVSASANEKCLVPGATIREFQRLF